VQAVIGNGSSVHPKHIHNLLDYPMDPDLETPGRMIERENVNRNRTIIQDQGWIMVGSGIQ
jgi:hypothetical protein